jgi:hypothetical protein
MSTSTQRIFDLLSQMQKQGGLSSIEYLIGADVHELSETLDSARELLSDWSLPAGKHAQLNELIKDLEGRLARTEKGLRARTAKSQLRNFTAPVTK